MFKKEKQIQLSKPDYSKKGSVDEKIKSLVDAINSKDNYYTTSSCSGRIIIYKETEKKKDVEWIFVSHDEISLEDIKEHMKKGLLFKFEPMILHVACADIKSAQRLVDKAIDAGFKKSGIIKTDKRILVDIRGTDFISVPIGNFDDEYLRLLVKESNRKMEKNEDKIKKFLLLIKNI